MSSKEGAGAGAQWSVLPRSALQLCSMLVAANTNSLEVEHQVEPEESALKHHKRDWGGGREAVKGRGKVLLLVLPAALA